MTEVCTRCGSKVAALASCPRCLLDADIGQEVVGERYQLLEEVGRGGMGAVFRARDLRSGAIVAVKLLRDDLAQRHDFVERFRREARAMALIRHPGVVGYRDWGIEDGRAYIVMDFVRGRSLAAQGPFDAKRALEIAREVCAAVAGAHRRGLVHRDLKPANLLVDRDGRIKISDFGIAASIGADAPAQPRLTGTHEVVGTPAYMAPETLNGAPPDPRMDVYSLGAVFYELVEGRPPQGYFVPPAPFEHVLRRALDPDPEQRYADAGEMLADLPAPAAPPVLRLAPRHSVRTIAAASVTAAGVLILARDVAERVVGGLMGTSSPWTAPGPAIVAAGLGIAASLRLRRGALPVDPQDVPPGGLPQTAGALRLALVTVVLAVTRVLPAVPDAVKPWLPFVFYGTQVAGLVAAFWGLLDPRRHGHTDEGLLWLAVALLLVPLGLDVVLPQ